MNPVWLSCAEGRGRLMTYRWTWEEKKPSRRYSPYLLQIMSTTCSWPWARQCHRSTAALWGVFTGILRSLPSYQRGRALAKPPWCKLWCGLRAASLKSTITPPGIQWIMFIGTPWLNSYLYSAEFILGKASTTSLMIGLDDTNSTSKEEKIFIR